MYAFGLDDNYRYNSGAKNQPISEENLQPCNHHLKQSIRLIGDTAGKYGMIRLP
jgi:hypothetical protein